MAPESPAARWQRREAEKWAVFRDQIDPQSWRAGKADASGGVVSHLSDDWLKALFETPYRSLQRSVNVHTGALRAIAFLTADDTYEVRVMSRARPEECYDFRWAFRAPHPDDDAGLPCGNVARRLVPARRSADGTVTGTANAVWLIAPERAILPVSPDDTVIRLFCADLDETIDLRLATLTVDYLETAQQQQARVMASQVQQNVEAETEARPWQALFQWMLRLREIDAQAFGRIPAPIKSALGRGTLTAPQVGQWQMQGLLPARLPRLEESRVGELRASMQLQKTLSTQPAITMSYTGYQMPLPFPRLVLAVDPRQLGVFDLQAFMTIGALREIHGAFDERIDELSRTDPGLRARVQGPGGKAQLLQDPKYMELLADPRLLQEVLDEQDVQQRRQGKYGPTEREMAIFLQQRQEDTMSMLGGVMLGAPMLGMAAMLPGQLAGRPPAPGSPPWKLYDPYLC